MEEIVLFVSSALTGGVAYDAVKVSLGSHYDKLSSYLSNGENAKFEGALEILLEDKVLREKIEVIMDGKTIEDSFKNLKASKIDVDLGKGAKVTDSFKDNTKASYYLNQKKDDFDYYGFVQVNENIKLSFASSFSTSLNLKSKNIDDLFADIMNELHNLEGRKLLMTDDVKERVK